MYRAPLKDLRQKWLEYLLPSKIYSQHKPSATDTYHPHLEWMLNLEPG